MKRRIACGLVLALLCGLSGGCAQGSDSGLKADDPVIIEMGTYYNGAAKIELDQLVEEFNNTVGDDKGIFVKAGSSGDMSEMFENLERELEKEAEDRSFPDIFSIYATNALKFVEEGLLADLGEYFTDEELDTYVDAYIEEGRIGKNGELFIFPIAKSTEVMTINKTDWDKFARESGADLEDLSTWEGLAETSRSYYEWTGGKALFGRDALANYVLTGMHQLDAEMFQIEDGRGTVAIDKDALRKIWDNYYLPYISGYYTSNGRFRSDDMKTGDLIAAIGSSSAGSYYAQEVTIEDKEPYPIDTIVLPVPNFEGTEPSVIQQGAGLAVVKSDKAKEEAAAVFLKWFTETEVNSRFSLASAYMPVKKDADNIESVEKIVKENNIEWNDMVRKTMEVAFTESRAYDLYTMTPFPGSDDCRNLVDSSLKETAAADREKVKELTSAGKSLEEAVAEYDTEDNFESWCNEIKEQFEIAVKG